MIESKEREAYRKACRYYGINGGCHKRSHVEDGNLYGISVDVACHPGCGCARMRRWDKLHKEK